MALSLSSRKRLPRIRSRRVMRNMQEGALANRYDVYNLLRQLGAPERLLRHAQLVGEAADSLIKVYRELGVEFDVSVIELGAAIHDAGKIVHPEELSGPGSRHEGAGQALVLKHGVRPEVAKCCISHAAWRNPDVTFEERTVALADKLWKGKRDTDLELVIIDEAAIRLGVGRWDVFARLDLAFEGIAASADERLRQSLT
jgi:hypothetical protein